MGELDLLRTAARLAARVQMHDVRMVKSASETHRLPESGVPFSYNQDLNSSVQMDLESGILVVEISFALSIRQEIEEREVEVADIAVSLASLYGITTRPDDRPFTQEEALAFAQTTGVLGLYPYWRELVSSITGRMALPPLTLGVYQVEFEPSDRPAELSN